jgi:hypothetical protein
MSRSWIIPVAETQAVVGWASTPEQDEREQKQAEDQDDFGAGKPELSLAIIFTYVSD